MSTQIKSYYCNYHAKFVCLMVHVCVKLGIKMKEGFPPSLG